MPRPLRQAAAIAYSGRVGMIDHASVSDLRDAAKDEVGKVVVGHDDAVELLLIAAIAHGHVLVEGPPGSAKTLLANAVARVLGVHFKRVQFTPDTSAQDIIGKTVFKLGEPVFQPGVALHERAARGRDQPHAAEDAGRAARGDAGAHRHPRRPAVHRSRTRSS